MELEYNNVQAAHPLEDFCRQWRAGVHPDGSCGYEVVTAPVSGKYIDECIGRDLGDALSQAEASANESCGVHVHVDAHDLQWADMMRLLRIYAHIEPVLYAIAGQNRVTNTYCLPVGVRYAAALESDDPKGSILHVAQTTGAIPNAKYGRDRLRANKPTKKDTGRYKGLNIAPWIAGRHRNARGKQWLYGTLFAREGKIPNPKPVARDTTVEFRLHRNTLDTRRVAGWAKLCAAVVDYAVKASDAEVKNLPKSALRALADVIAPQCKPFILRRIKAWMNDTSYRSRKMSPTGGWRITCAA